MQQTMSSGGVAIRGITITALRADPSGDEFYVTIDQGLDLRFANQEKNYEILRRKLLPRVRLITVCFSLDGRYTPAAKDEPEFPKSCELHAIDPADNSIVFIDKTNGNRGRQLYLHNFSLSGHRQVAYDIELLPPSVGGGRLYPLYKGTRMADLPKREYHPQPVEFTLA